MRNKRLLLLLVFLFSVNAFAGIKNIGTPYILNYLKDNYNSGTQNWSIAQDQNGMMYFANNSGLLVFDGIYWRTYPLPNYSIVRSVAIGSDGKIWVGGFNEAGYFYADNSGQLVYRSLNSKIPETHRDFGEVWRIYSIGDKMLVQSFTKIFSFRSDTLAHLISDYDMHFSFMLNDTLFVKVNNKGIYKYQDDSLRFVEGTSLFGDKVVSGITQLGKSGKLIFTSENGVFRLQGSKTSVFNPAISEYLSKNQVFCAASFDGTFLAGTVRNGIMIFDQEGNILQQITKDNGLQNSTILSVFKDNTDNIWLGLDNGIDYIRTNSPLSYLANKDDVGAGYVSVQYKDHIFMGTNQGLYYLKWEEGSTIQNSLKFVAGTQGQVWSLVVIKDLLLIGHDKGSFTFDGNRLIKISSEQGGWNFTKIPGKNNLLIQGLYNGLLVYEYKETSGWKIRNRILNFNESSRELYFDKDNKLWVGRGYIGIYKLEIDSSFYRVERIDQYDADDGLKSINGIRLHFFEDQIVASNELGLFAFDNQSDRFVPHKRLGKYFNSQNVHKFIPDPNTNVWFFLEGKMGVLRSTYDGTYIMEYLPFTEITNKLFPTYESINFIDQYNVVIATEDGFIHFDPNFRKNYEIDFAALIRQVGTADSVIYAGYSSNSISGASETEIPFRYNTLAFSFSAPRFISRSDLNFSYFLEGFESDWSDWSSSAEKEYTNLKDGYYIFRVRAIDQFGNLSREDSFSFRVLPPWYRSVTAYILYVILIILIAYLIGKYIVRKIEKEKALLKRNQEREMKEKESLFREEVMQSEQEIIKLKNEKLEIENARNKAELESKSKELGSIAMQMTYKNEILSGVKQKLTKVSQTMLHLPSKKQVEELIKSLEKDIVKDDDWERFELSFDQVHEDFIKKLRKSYPELTPKDLRLCAYLRMNLSSKEIAPLLNISIRGVEISRYRLRKKIDLPRDANLIDFMMKI